MQTILLIIFCAVVGSRAQKGTRAESYEALGFNEKQKLYLLKKELAHVNELKAKDVEIKAKKAEIKAKDSEIKVLQENLTNWKPMVVSINLSNFKTAKIQFLRRFGEAEEF
jgi:cell shape-determining protein MreC